MAVLIGAATLALGGMSAANASTPGPGGCSGGPIYGGTYQNYSVTGDCYLAEGADLVVRGNVTIAPGASLDATRWSDSSLTVWGSVSAGPGSRFAMGCSDEAHPCADGSGKAHGQDSVRGSVTFDRIYNAAINNAVINGSLTSTGGGAGNAPFFVPFSVKDDTIKGNLKVTGLNTVWFGVVRSTIGGSVTLSHNTGHDPDANEVVANTIGGSLSCTYNSPPAQFGDAANPQSPYDYGWNDVRGHATGECASLVRPAVSR